MEILEFIENFRCGLGQFTKKESGIVQQLFENGFCYYFAKILKDAFPGGEYVYRGQSDTLYTNTTINIGISVENIFLNSTTVLL